MNRQQTINALSKGQRVKNKRWSDGTEFITIAFSVNGKLTAVGEGHCFLHNGDRYESLDRNKKIEITESQLREAANKAGITRDTTFGDLEEMIENLFDN